MNTFEDEFKAQFDSMKQLIQQNTPSKHDRIPTGSEHRHSLLWKHTLVAQNAQNKNASDDVLHLQTNSDPISCHHLCTKNPKDLTDATLSKLHVNQINIGKKLTAKVISECVQMVGVNVIIEDKEQNAITLALYNFAPLRSPKNELDSLLPIGSTLIIKEPYVKKSVSGQIAIRIDNIHCNIIILHRQPHVIKEKDTLKLKQIGNEYFKKKQYKWAIQYYSKSIQSMESNKGHNISTKCKLLANRSLCYLKLKKYEEAVHDAQHALDLDKDSIKIRYRLATALTGVRKHTEALRVINAVNTEEIKSHSIKNDFERLKDRIYRRFTEADEFFQWYSVEQIHSMSWEQMQDIEDYYSSSIKVKFINSRKGRGIIATKDIAKDEVIVSEKCITFGDIDKDRMSTLIDHRLNTAYYPSKIHLIQNIVNIYKDGRDIDKFRISMLYQGGKYDKNNIIIPKMKWFKVDTMPKKDIEIKILNIEQIREIAEKNSFTMATNDKAQKEYIAAYQKSKKDGEQFAQWCIGSGLFIVPSLFNHDDHPNVNWQQNYKRIHLTAVRDIKKGEELCIKYHRTGVKNWIN